VCLCIGCLLEVDRILVSAPNVMNLSLLADTRLRPKVKFLYLVDLYCLLTAFHVVVLRYMIVMVGVPVGVEWDIFHFLR